MSRDIVSDVYADLKSWREIRFRLFAVFKGFADAARMVATYGNKQPEKWSGYK